VKNIGENGYWSHAKGKGNGNDNDNGNSRQIELIEQKNKIKKICCSRRLHGVIIRTW